MVASLPKGSTAASSQLVVSHQNDRERVNHVYGLSNVDAHQSRFNNKNNL